MNRIGYSSGQCRSVEETGPVAMLRSLVFGGNTQTITSAISNASGVKPSTAASLFSVALPTVLGYLSRLVTRENLDAAGLGRRLAAERTPLIAVLPAAWGRCCRQATSGWQSHAAVDTSHGRHVPYRGTGTVEPPRKGSGAWIAAAVLGLFALGALYALLGPFSQRTCGNARRDRHRGLCCASAA